MGRRSDHSRAQLRDLCLGAARRVIGRAGLRGLTARRVARDIGYSPGTLYNLFENLDELVIRVNAGTLDELRDHLAREVRSDRPAAANLIALARAYVEWTQDNANLWDAVLNHRMAAGRRLPDWYAAQVSDLFRLVEAALVPLLGEQAEAARRRAARALWSALHGISALGLTRRLDVVAAEPAEVLAEHLVATYLAGLDSEIPGPK